MISILLHIHNRDKFLEKFLDCLSDQVFKDFELNILETANLSTTISILKNYKNKIKINCFSLHTKFVDRTKSLNFLANHCNGNIICISDVDVMKQPDFLEEINAKITNSNFCIQFVKRLDQRKTHYYFAKQTNLNNVIDECKNIELNKGGMSQIAIEKMLFFKIGGYDEQFFGWGYEDSDLYRRLCSSNLTITELKSIGIHLWHERSPMFNFRKDEINLDIYKKNLENDIIVVKNKENIRLDNQHNQSILEPQKVNLDRI
jgi:predicted glycosyltransferase involved in capsule biosynthesis